MSKPVKYETVTHSNIPSWNNRTRY